MGDNERLEANFQREPYVNDVKNLDGSIDITNAECWGLTSRLTPSKELPWAAA